jgi:hypothetical protein
MLLKIGSTGEYVKKLQTKLGLTADGTFGTGTETAVKKWQTANGLVADGVVGAVSLAKLGITPSTPTSANKYSKEKIETVLKKKGYKWFEGKDYVLNIVGVRNSDTQTRVTNAFDDRITVSYQVNGEWIYKEWMNTVDPGTKGVKEYHNVAGVARLVPGQYINSHALGLHQGKYEALKQQNSVKVFRDANKDMNYDETKIQEGIFGINIHKAGADSTYVENWSEGCQVFKRAVDFEEFMTLAKKSASMGNKSFTYTLIDSNNII